MKKQKSVYNNVLQLIGETPLVKLNNITSNLNGKFYAKLEPFLFKDNCLQKIVILADKFVCPQQPVKNILPIIHDFVACLIISVSV